jgi:hypothetical protein
MRIVLGGEIPRIHLMRGLHNLNIVVVLLTMSCIQTEARLRVPNHLHPSSMTPTFRILSPQLVQDCKIKDPDVPIRVEVDRRRLLHPV